MAVFEGGTVPEIMYLLQGQEEASESDQPQMTQEELAVIKAEFIASFYDPAVSNTGKCGFIYFFSHFTSCFILFNFALPPKAKQPQGLCLKTHGVRKASLA